MDGWIMADQSAMAYVFLKLETKNIQIPTERRRDKWDSGGEFGVRLWTAVRLNSDLIRAVVNKETRQVYSQMHRRSVMPGSTVGSWRAGLGEMATQDLNAALLITADGRQVSGGG